jgi:DNA-binding transcriptional MerR regulator
MRIGVLAARTGVPTRLLRYYEAQGLLAPTRAANGYRSYGESSVNRVTQIRGLLDAGVPTRIIKEILPCLDDPRTIHVADATPEILAALERKRDQLDARIQCLIRNRDAISAYLAVVRDPAAPDPASGSDPDPDPDPARDSDPADRCPTR